MKYAVLTKRKLLLFCLIFVLLIAILCTAVKVSFVVSASYSAKKLPIYSVETNEKKVALTFNAAWDDSDVTKILSILDNYKIKASFFLVGQWAEKYPESAKLIYSKGHELQSHSYSHKDMTKLSQHDAIAEITKAQDAISKITGTKPLLFRAPSGAYDSKTIEIAEEVGVIPIQWSCDSIDWKNPSPEKMNERILKKLKTGSIMLFHVGAKNTPDALPAIIENIKKQGYEFVLVSELIYKDNYVIDSTGRQHKEVSAFESIE